MAGMFQDALSFSRNLPVSFRTVMPRCNVSDMFLNAPRFTDVKMLVQCFAITTKKKYREEVKSQLKKMNPDEVYPELSRYSGKHVETFKQELEKPYPRLKKITVSDELQKDDSGMYRPGDKIELIRLLRQNVPLGEIDTGSVTDMSCLFKNSTRSDFSGIEKWDTSKVTTMRGMFSGAKQFNHNIENWNTSSVTDTSEMFENAAEFNQPLEKWDMSSVTDMHRMFYNAVTFNQSLNGWNVSKVTSMYEMFYNCMFFNQPLNNWDVSKVEDMGSMFAGCRLFDGDICSWNVSRVRDMSFLFLCAASFDQDISGWDTGSVTNMRGMFDCARMFNRPLENWDVSKVTDMSRMFQNTLCFNQPLEKWDISSVTNMGSMFNTARDFNQPLEKWDVSRVTNMVEMFAVIDTFPGGGRQAFNRPLTGWKLRTQDTYHMFYYSGYSHLETLIMATASSGTDYTPAGYRANVKEQLKNLCGRFGKETVRNALIEYKDKYATGTLLNVLEEMG